MTTDERDAFVKTLAKAFAHIDSMTPEWMEAIWGQIPAREPLEDPATKLVLLQRALLAGLPEWQACELAVYLDADNLVAVCELVEAGCDLKTAAAIVL